MLMKCTTYAKYTTHWRQLDMFHNSRDHICRLFHLVGSANWSLSLSLKFLLNGLNHSTFIRAQIINAQSSFFNLLTKNKQGQP